MTDRARGYTALVNALRRDAKLPRMSSLVVPLLEDAADAIEGLQAARAEAERERDKAREEATRRTREVEATYLVQKRLTERCQEAERERDELLAANRRLDQAWQAKDKRCQELEQALRNLAADAEKTREDLLATRALALQVKGALDKEAIAHANTSIDANNRIGELDAIIAMMRSRCRELERERDEARVDFESLMRIHTALTADAPPEKTP